MFQLEIIANSWHITNFVMHGEINVRDIMDYGRLRREHVARHQRPFLLRHLPPAAGRIGSFIALVGRRKGITGRILITIDVLVGINKDGRRDGGIERLHMNFVWLHMGQIGIHCIHVVILVKSFIRLSVHQSVLIIIGFKKSQHLSCETLANQKHWQMTFRVSLVQIQPIIRQMKSIIRNIVAGPKKKTPYNGQELDLTYITDRVIAMAYPASNFLEKAYRNSITDVANYLNQYHKNNYLIINVSSRPYDYTKFNNQVLQYEWPDHQAPPLTTLFQIAYRAFQYLKNSPQGVIAVHCNHGKGRTGTAIISILLYLGIFKNAQEALTFYNSRRFSSESYGVDQPCQTRYLTYFQDILSMPKIPERLIAFRLCSLTQTGLHEKHFVSITQVRTSQILVEKFRFGSEQDVGSYPLVGDLFIQIFEEAWPSSKQVARINYHSFFLHPDTELSIKSLKKDSISVTFRGNEISSKKTGDQKNFSITLSFQYFCLCHIKGSEGVECQCQPFREPQQKHWRKMIQQKKVAQQVSRKDRATFFSAPFQQSEKEIKEGQNVECQNVYQLEKNISNLEQNKKAIGRLKESSELKQQEEKIAEGVDLQELKAQPNRQTQNSLQGAQQKQFPKEDNPKE